MSSFRESPPLILPEILFQKLQIHRIIVDYDPIERLSDRFIFPQPSISISKRIEIMIRTINFTECLGGTRFKRACYFLVWLVPGVLASLTGFGCTNEHKVNLNPEVFVRVSNLGKGERLVVRVNDIRLQKAISKKESNFKVSSGRAINTVNIYASSNVRDTVLDKVTEGFERMGFHPSKYGNPSSKKITVEISKLQMNYEREKIGLEIPEVHARMETILRVTASNRNESFKKIYRTRMTKSHRIFTGKFKNERLINNGLSLAIQKMFGDPELLQFLSSD